MPETLKDLKKMTLKTLKTENQRQCFEACTFFMEQNCMGMRSSCVQEINITFDNLAGTMKRMDGKLDMILKDLGLNGRSK